MAELSPLLPLRHKQCDLFIADIFDNVPIKDEMTTMEHPFFSLSTKPNIETLKYENGEDSIEVIPSALGMPTIFDKDILLYSGSAIKREIHEGRTPARTLKTSPLDILTVCNRETNGKAYKRLVDALNRLRGCTINSTYQANGVKTTKGHGFIDDFRIDRAERDKGRIIGLEITVSQWYYDFIISNNVLTIDPAYFQIRKSIDRRIYEIARKHCNKSKKWEISLEKLHKKTGLRSPLKKFRLHVRALVKTNHLPEYLASFDDARDVVVFGHRTKMMGNENQPDFFDTSSSSLPSHIPPNLLEDVKSVVGIGLDYYDLWHQYINWSGSQNATNIRGGFIGFCRKKAAQSMRAG